VEPREEEPHAGRPSLTAISNTKEKDIVGQNEDQEREKKKERTQRKEKREYEGKGLDGEENKRKGRKWERRLEEKK
jgi:hypothetical protein